MLEALNLSMEYKESICDSMEFARREGSLVDGALMELDGGDSDDELWHPKDWKDIGRYGSLARSV